MYADRLEGAAKTPIKERLNGSSMVDSARRRQVTGKRQRRDDRWEHDLYDDNEPHFSSRKIGSQDLRLKLQRKAPQSMPQRGKRNLAGGILDLREKLSGAIHLQPGNAELRKPKSVLETGKSAAKDSVVETPMVETKKAANPTPRRKSQQKAESVDNFLRSLGLEKYSITLQAEEVDMSALVHMTDEDLKAIGIPMGPRKKILLALESKVT